MNSPPYSVAIVSWQRQRHRISAVRQRVFIQEQGVPPELEWDGLDAAAVQVLATAPDRRAIGTARMIDGHIGRMCVLPAWRGRGVGSALLTTLLDYARRHQVAPLWLNAQTSAIRFYEYHGFTPVGEVFMDADIPHRRMEYQHPGA